MYNENFLTDPVAITQKLITYNTINGVNPEKDCILFVKSLMDEMGMETNIFYNIESRPNVLGIYRSKSEKKLPPLLLYGHLDVVSVSNQKWSVDPFAGIIKDGYLWGRGAIDMKGQHGIMLSSLFKIIKNNIELPFDIYYLAVSDEEGTSDYGVKYLVENYPNIFDNVKFAIGEMGGFTFDMAGKQVYLIQVAEKQVVEIKIIAKGKGGHGSLKHRGTALERLSEAIVKLSKDRLPVRITPPVKAMLEEMIKIMDDETGMWLKLLLKEDCTDFALDKMNPYIATLLDPLLHNNLNVTMVGGGDAVNVIPSEVWCKCDLRLVPGCSLEDALDEINNHIGPGFDIEIHDYTKGASESDLSLVSGMIDSIKKYDPEATPIPFVVSGVTDGRFLSQLGIQSYGYTPMKCPKDYDLLSLAHDADERVPVDALTFGSEVLYDFILNEYEKALK